MNHKPIMTPRRKKMMLGWLVLSLTWSTIRSIAIARLFGPHGTNALIYFFIDITTTVPYAIFSAKAVYALVDKSKKLKHYMTIGGITFFAPDMYVIASAHQVADTLWISFAIYLTIVTGLAIYQHNLERKKALR